MLKFEGVSWHKAFQYYNDSGTWKLRVGERLIYETLKPHMKPLCLDEFYTDNILYPKNFLSYLVGFCSDRYSVNLSALVHLRKIYHQLPI